MGGFVAAEIEHLRSVPQAALLRESPRIGEPFRQVRWNVLILDSESALEMSRREQEK